MTKQLNLTVLQWFEMLPVKLRDKAQAYAMDDYGNTCYYADRLVDSLEKALLCGFKWRLTEEGYDKWATVHSNAPHYQSAYIKKHNL